MADRWEAPTGRPSDSADETPARDEGALPAEAVESWRTWLLTGHSGVVSDRRRVRGSHRGIKQMLVEGTATDMPQSWRHFSGAMVRLAINDALNALPRDQTHVVWLAYFAGLSNREIAKRLGMSVGGVQRRLKTAFEYVSDYVEHGRTAGRRAVYALLGWLSLRWLADHHQLTAGAIVAAGAAAVVLAGATAVSVARPAVPPAVATHAAAPATSSGPAPSVSLPNSVADTIGKIAHKVVPAGVALPPLPAVPPVPSPLPLPTPLPTP